MRRASKYKDRVQTRIMGPNQNQGQHHGAERDQVGYAPIVFTNLIFMLALNQNGKGEVMTDL